jgi:hypothetical protein
MLKVVCRNALIFQADAIRVREYLRNVQQPRRALAGIEATLVEAPKQDGVTCLEIAKALGHSLL